MKTFRELISWELEQEKRQTRSAQIAAEDPSSKLASCMLRKLRYLSSAGAGAKSSGAPVNPG